MSAGESPGRGVLDQLNAADHDRLVTRFSQQDEGTLLLTTTRLDDDVNSALRAELNVPDGWALETLDYDLGCFDDSLKNYGYVVHGTRAVPPIYLAETDGEPVNQVMLEGGLLEITRGNGFPLHPCNIFTAADSTLVIAIGEVEGLADLHRAGRLVVSFALLPRSRRIYQGQSPVFAERRWHPHTGERQYIGGIEQPHEPGDVARAADSFPLFDRFVAFQTKPLGRKRLEESPSSPWRAYAEQARELLATKEVRTIRQAAERLMVDYDSLGGDSIAIAKDIRAAEVRLGGYLKKLREQGE